MSPARASGLDDRSVPSGTVPCSCWMASEMVALWPRDDILSSVFSMCVSRDSSKRPSTALCVNCFLYCPMPMEFSQTPTAELSHWSGDVVSMYFF